MHIIISLFYKEQINYRKVIYYLTFSFDHIWGNVERKIKENILYVLSINWVVLNLYIMFYCKRDTKHTQNQKRNRETESIVEHMITHI